jgi:hypothetical protein
MEGFRVLIVEDERDRQNSMTADQCSQRASECAANAALAVDQAISVEFLRLAAQWRAIAVRRIFIGDIGIAMAALGRFPET